MTHRHPWDQDWEKVDEEPGRRLLMQRKWKQFVVEKVLLTAMNVSMTVQEICDVLRRHWGKSEEEPRKDDQERDRR